VTRHLTWDGCVNVRDLGGHPTEDGFETAYGRVVRADNLGRLSPAGWEALAAYGVRLVVDLRWADERAEDAAHAEGIEVVHVPLFGDNWEPLEAERAEEIAEYAERRTAAYLERLERYGDRFARAMAAVVEPDVCVAVHCAGGVDRTGLISAFLLRLASVDPREIAADYAHSEVNWAPYVRTWIDEADDEDERNRRLFLATVPAATMLAVLERLDADYGGVGGYLRAAGLPEADLELARRKLRP
jgi:protein-tyrosine phosphatase